MYSSYKSLSLDLYLHRNFVSDQMRTMNPEQIGIFLVLCFLSVATSTETRCERWQGTWYQKFMAVRCVKGDNVPADNIVVSHNVPCLGSDARSPCIIKYTVGTWTGACAEDDGRNRLFPNQYLRKRGSQVYRFEGVGPGICTEFYVFDCQKDGRPYDCYYAIRLAHVPVQ